MDIIDCLSANFVCCQHIWVDTDIDIDIEDRDVHRDTDIDARNIKYSVTYRLLCP